MLKVGDPVSFFCDTHEGVISEIVNNVAIVKEYRTGEKVKVFVKNLKRTEIKVTLAQFNRAAEEMYNSLKDKLSKEDSPESYDQELLAMVSKIHEDLRIRLFEGNE